jgi:hypothetical protein
MTYLTPKKEGEVDDKKGRKRVFLTVKIPKVNNISLNASPTVGLTTRKLAYKGGTETKRIR